MGKAAKTKKNKTASAPDKCPKAWEKARRDRIKVLFEELSRLLPKYDPAVPPSRPEIIQKAMVYIRELQAQNEDLLNGGFDEVYRKKIEMWKRRVKDLVARVEQLSNILRTANIHLPPLALEGMPAWATNRPKHWTDKLNIADDKIDELIKRLGDVKTKTPKTKKIVKKKKKKKEGDVKDKENPAITEPKPVVAVPTVSQSSTTIIPSINQSGTFLLTNEGNLLPVITPTANVLTPVIINRPPVLVLQAQPQPRPLPIIISKPPPNKRRIYRESTVMTFSNKRPISALSKQSHTRRGGKCLAHKTGNAELQPATTSSAVSPTAAFLNSFPVVTTPKIVTSEESETQVVAPQPEEEEIPVVEKEKEKETEVVAVAEPEPEPQEPPPKTPEIPKIPTPEPPPIVTAIEPVPVVAEPPPPTTTISEIRTWDAVPKTTEPPHSLPLTENFPAISFPSSWPTQPQATQNSWLIPPIYSSENKTWRPMEPTWSNTTEPWKTTTTQQTNFKIGLYETTSSSQSNCESTWSSQDPFQHSTWNPQQKPKKTAKPLKIGTPIVSYGMNAFPPPPLLQSSEPYTFVSDTSYAPKSSFLDVSKSLFNESYGLTVPKTPVSEANFFSYQPACNMQAPKTSVAATKTKNSGYSKQEGLWNAPYLGQSGNEIWNQFDYSYNSGISEPKDNRPKPPINWMTEPERTEICADDSYRNVDFCFNGPTDEEAKTRSKKKDEGASQDYFGWVSMKVDPLVVPSTLPTLVGDLALGLVNDPIPAKKCKTTPEKNEPFANLSKNIFDNENPKQETIVLKNIFELPASGGPSKQRTNPGNNFLSVSQLVETQETKSDYIYYNQRTKGKRASGWKCEKKCQQPAKCSSYSAEALMRPSEQEPDYQFALEFQPEPVLDDMSALQQDKLKTYPAARKPDYWRQEQNLLTKTKPKSSSLPFYSSQPNLQLPPSAPVPYPRFPALATPQTKPETPFAGPELARYPGPRKPYTCPRPASKPPSYPTYPDNRKPVQKLQQQSPTYTKMLSPVAYPGRSNTMQQSPNPGNPAAPLTIGSSSSSSSTYPTKSGAIPNQKLASPNATFPLKSQPNPVIGSHLSYLSKCPAPVQNPVIGSSLPIGTSYPTFPPLPPHTPGTSGSSLANFNLSTIFPEMNKKGYQGYS